MFYALLLPFYIAPHRPIAAWNRRHFYQWQQCECQRHPVAGNMNISEIEGQAEVKTLVWGEISLVIETTCFPFGLDLAPCEKKVAERSVGQFPHATPHDYELMEP